MDAHRTRRHAAARRAAFTAVALVAGVASSSVAAGADQAGSAPIAEPVWQQLAARQELQRIVDLMPAGWPATEVMREQATEPLGDIHQRMRWSEDAARMPAEWPATLAMQASTER